MDLRGNSDYISESLIAYEAGYRWQVRRNLSFDIAAFYNVYDDIYALGNTANPFDPDLSSKTLKRVRAMGSNFPLPGRQIVLCRLPSVYTWQDLDLNYKNPESVASFSTRPTLSAPEHQAAIRTSYDFAEQWQRNLWLRYASSFDGRNNEDRANDINIPAQWNLDANVIWKPLKNLEIMLAGQNLLKPQSTAVRGGTDHPTHRNRAGCLHESHLELLI